LAARIPPDNIGLQQHGELPMARGQRKLAAILAADVVGYSRLMGRDESGTLARLREHRKECLGRHLRLRRTAGQVERRRALCSPGASALPGSNRPFVVWRIALPEAFPQDRRMAGRLSPCNVAFVTQLKTSVLLI
jgi:hypothetical protein